MDRRLFGRGAAQSVLAGVALVAAGEAMAERDSRLPPPADPPLPTGAESRFATVNGIRMHYVVAGQGPTVILLHGWPQTWFAWHGQIERLARRFRVVAADLRGTGLSEVTPSGYDKRTIAEDIRALIGHLGVPQAHVVGHDMGGKAAYILAHLHPGVVSKLVLVDCLLPGTENMDALRGGAWHYGFHMAPDFPEMLTKGRERDYIAAQIRAWSHRKDAIGEDAITVFAAHYAQPGRMTAGFNYYRALREDAPLAAELRGRRLPMPVMAVAGRQSGGSRLADSLRAEAPSLTSVIIDDCGHFVAEEAPDPFAKAVETFLA
ncbi:alpha/beta fold hydrolase [Enterovirga rhinocerotis]|nr:alpha/beta hydrolase [Enterovirga rhinocerotis]